MSTIVLTRARIFSFSEGILEGCLIIRNGVIEDIRTSNECTFPNAKYVDVKGKTIIPAFIDAHAHLFSIAARYEWVDLSAIPTMEDLKKTLGKIANAIGPGKWILGYGWDESKWRDEKRYPTVKDLDEVAPSNPVLIRRIDGHLAVVNSMALELLNIPDNIRGIDKDSEGRKTGILKEDALEYAMRKVKYKLESLSKGVLKVTKMAWEKGVSMSHETFSLEDLSLLSYILDRNEYLGIEFYVFVLEKYIDYIIDRGLNKLDLGQVRIGGIKVFSDGSIGARTAALREPYRDDPSNRGMLLKDKDELTELFKKADKANLQLAIHAIGDRAIDTVLEALKEAKVRKELRHRIEHFELVQEEHIELVKKLGIVLSMQPNFVGQWQMPGGMYEKRLGKERWRKMNPFKKLLDAGILVAFGSDCMPFDPIFGLWSAVNHPIQEYRTSVEEAIKAYTLNAAYAAHEEKLRGDIKPGNIADLTILSHDLTRINDLRDLRVIGTIIRGEIRYISY